MSGLELSELKRVIKEAIRETTPSKADVLTAWRAWVDRTGSTDSKLTLYADGAATLQKSDCYSREQHFETSEELCAFFQSA